MKLPPFGRAVADLRRQGLRPLSGAVRLYVDHWPECRLEHTSYPPVVLPDDAEPDAFDWRFLIDLDVFLMWCPDLTASDRLRALLRCLLSAEPQRLIVVDRNAKQMHWVKSVGLGIEVSL